MSTAQNAREVASAMDAVIRRLPEQNVPGIRAVRRAFSRKLGERNADFVLGVARQLHHVYGHQWVALEIIRNHEPALSWIGKGQLQEFARGLDSWGEVDAFAVYLAGPAWLRGQAPDHLFHAWARSENRWLRRAALVSTVVLNTPTHGGKGDVRRTLAICELLVGDRDDTVVKALSWALRRLVAHDSAAVRRFMDEHEQRLAGRVKREVGNKLATGLKNPPRGRS